MMEKPVFDLATMTGPQIAEVWPDLRRYLADPCSAILVESVTNSWNDAEARAERYKRLKAKRVMAAEMRTERPR